MPARGPSGRRVRTGAVLAVVVVVVVVRASLLYLLAEPAVAPSSGSSREGESPWEAFHRQRDRGAVAKQGLLPLQVPIGAPPRFRADSFCHGFLPCLDVMATEDTAPAGRRIFDHPRKFFFVETNNLESSQMHRLQDSMLATSQHAIGLIMEPNGVAFAEIERENRSNFGIANYQATQSRDCKTPYIRPRPPKDWPKLSSHSFSPQINRLIPAHTLLSLMLPH